MKPRAEDVFAGSPPLAFTFGLGGLVVFPLRFGASSLLTERNTPLELAQLVHDRGVTVLFTAPTAVRAVGTACATNPLPIVVPCHRVLRTDGALGGYIGGLDAKTALLTLERTA